MSRATGGIVGAQVALNQAFLAHRHCHHHAPFIHRTVLGKQAVHALHDGFAQLITWLFRLPGRSVSFVHRHPSSTDAENRQHQHQGLKPRPAMKRCRTHQRSDCRQAPKQQREGRGCHPSCRDAHSEQHRNHHHWITLQQVFHFFHTAKIQPFCELTNVFPEIISFSPSTEINS